MDLEVRHTQHAEKHRAELAAVARLLADREEFTLDLPAALDLGAGPKPVPVSCLGSHLKASQALASPQLQRWLQLGERLGSEAAWHQLANDPEEGEEFCVLWDEAQAELKEGVVCSVNDLVSFVTAARAGFHDRPQHLLVVLQYGGKLTSYKVEVAGLLR